MFCFIDAILNMQYFVITDQQRPVSVYCLQQDIGRRQSMKKTVVLVGTFDTKGKEKCALMRYIYD